MWVILRLLSKHFLSGHPRIFFGGSNVCFLPILYYFWPKKVFLCILLSANCRDHLKQICMGSKDDYCLHLYKNRKGQFAANFEVFGLKSFLFYKCHSEGMKINSTFKYLNMKRLCLEQLIQTSKLVFRFTFGKFSICDSFQT